MGRYLADLGQAFKSASSFPDSLGGCPGASGNLLNSTKQASASHYTQPQQSSIRTGKAANLLQIQDTEVTAPEQEGQQTDWVKAYLPQTAPSPYDPHLGGVSPQQQQGGWDLQPGNGQQAAAHQGSHRSEGSPPSGQVTAASG